MDAMGDTRATREKEKAQYEMESSVAREMPIFEQISHLAEGLDYLADIIATSEKRLEPILAPEGPNAAEKSSEADVQIHSDLAVRLENLSNRLRRSIGRLQEINNRLEL